MKTQKAKLQHLGFSLIDVLITVAIVGILAAIVYPSYQAIMRKNNRAAAESYLAVNTTSSLHLISSWQ